MDYGLKGRLPVLAFTRDNPRGFAFFDRSERYLGKDGILVTTKTAAEVTGASDATSRASRRSAASRWAVGAARSTRSTSTAASA